MSQKVRENKAKRTKVREESRTEKERVLVTAIMREKFWEEEKNKEIVN